MVVMEDDLRVVSLIDLLDSWTYLTSDYIVDISHFANDSSHHYTLFYVRMNQ
jgi:hypothetical protein